MWHCVIPNKNKLTHLIINCLIPNKNKSVILYIIKCRCKYGDVAHKLRKQHYHKQHILFCAKCFVKPHRNAFCRLAYLPFSVIVIGAVKRAWTPRSRTAGGTNISWSARRHRSRIIWRIIGIRRSPSARCLPILLMEAGARGVLGRPVNTARENNRLDTGTFTRTPTANTRCVYCVVKSIFLFLRKWIMKWTELNVVEI